MFVYKMQKILYRAIWVSLMALLSSSLQVSAQECDGLLARFEADDIIYTRESKALSRRELRKDLETIKAQMLDELKIKMAERILTEVKTSSTSSVMESGRVFEDFYNYESEISATASLAFGSSEFCIDEDNKVIYGIYSLDRIKTAQAVVLDCENRMSKLLAEIRQANQVERTRNIDLFKSRSEKINRDARIASFLDINSDQSKLIALYEEFQSEYQYMQTKAGKNTLREELLNARGLIDNQEYLKAISKLKKLDIEYPDRSELKALLNDAQLRLYSYTLNSVLNLEPQEKYKEALLEIDQLCKAITCDEKVLEIKTNLTRKYFDQEYEAFEKAVKFDLKAQVEMHYQVLSRMASSNTKDFEEVKREYEIFKIEGEMREVEKDLQYKNFHAAFAEVKNIEYKYAVSYSPLEGLRKRTENLLLKHEVKKEKRKRPKHFSLAIGIETISNSDSKIREALYPETFSLAYSAGLYKKFNHTRYYRGSYPRLSDMIGVKVRMVDFWNSFSVPREENEVPAFNYRYNTEVLVDGTALYFLHYSAGVIFVDRELSSDLAYCAEIGFRLPMGPISFQGNLRYVTFNEESEYMAQLGLFANIDFWRQFGIKDKRDIKKKYGL